MWAYSGPRCLPLIPAPVGGSEGEYKTYLKAPVMQYFFFFFFFLNCMFYQLLRVQHSCSSTQSWGSVLPSILFSNRNLGSFCA